MHVAHQIDASVVEFFSLFKFAFRQHKPINRVYNKSQDPFYKIRISIG